eukprot:TRINITY_DN27635_c0_g1_i1.p1 TRINITY_DN27635_c0_g1~~TRINITY_DN27635_c0_g1_i1.p1  ORF type:complete len:177 (+),score=24.96 TRINITY_DN27635_c0_g1_i1:46-531(+)
MLPKHVLILMAVQMVVGVEFSLSYVDKGSVLQSVPIGVDDWAEIEESEITLKNDANGELFDSLVATCVAMTPAGIDTNNTRGWCNFVSPSGADSVTEFYEGILTEQGGHGTAVFKNGKGKFDKLHSTHTWTYQFTSRSEDRYEGVGTKHGNYYFEDASGEL